MQVEGHHIGGGESALGQIGEKQLVDNAAAGEADPTLLFSSRMGRHHDAKTEPIRPHRDIRTVVERAQQLAFRTRELLIGWQVQAALDLGPLQQGIVFAPCHEREASQISEHSPGAILPIQSQQGMRRGEVLCLKTSTGWPRPRGATLPDTRHCRGLLA